MTTESHGPHTPTPTAPDYWTAGDSYDQTADEPLDRIATRLRQDLADIQADGMIHDRARFTVAADTSGPVGVIRTRILGLARTLDPDRSLTTEALRVAFALASHYNRVNLTRPDQVRFIHCITAVHDDDTIYGIQVGAILGHGYPWPAPTRKAPSAASETPHRVPAY